MPILDSRAIDTLAELICDRDGPYERRVPALLKFLRAAGWDVDYEDGQARVPWLVHVISDRNDNRSAIESVLARLIDPREYDGGLADAQAFVNPINEAVRLDGYEVSHQAGRPIVRRVDDSHDLDQVAVSMASSDLRAKISDLIGDHEVADLLIQRLDEVDLCRRAGAYLMAVVGTGSFVEGVLYEVLRPRDTDTRKEKSSTLDALLTRAHKRGWIEDDAHRFGEIVRDYRNLVHPRRQRELDARPDDDTVLLCWQPVLAMVNDLHRLVPRIPKRASGS